MHPNERGNNTELVALRRKKNADAQAAFRKRRASYISSLETTVHGLEQVIRNLQESVQECKVNETNLKRDNDRLTYELETTLRKLHGTPPRTADQGHGQQHWSAPGYRTAQPPYPPQMPASPSFTPPLSSANGSPSPPASSIMSSASAVPTPASPYIQTAAGSNGYIAEEHPVNLLSRPLNMYRDTKGHPIAVDGGVYSYQTTRGQEAGGWIDSPVQTATGVHSFGYQQQGDSPQASHSGRQMPLSLNLAVDNSRTAYSSASASPTTTDSGSPYVTRGHVPGFAPAAPTAHGGLDAGAAFRSYFSQATGNGEPSTSSLTGVSHLRTDPGPMSHMPPPLGPPSLSRSDVSLAPPPISRDGEFDDDILDDEDRPGGDDPIVSQTLAVLKSHAFGGSRKPRVRSIRGVQRHESNGRSALSPDRD